MISLTQKDIERFWGYVNKEISQNFYNGTRCWEWIGSRLPTGYGKLRIDHKNYRSSRISYQLAFGEIPIGLFVLHHCDNPPCCNPSHLFLGTDKDNAMDRASKGRGGDIRGEKNGNLKLSDLQIEEIRKRYECGEKIIPLSKVFGVHFSHIYRIVKNISRA